MPRDGKHLTICVQPKHSPHVFLIFRKISVSLPCMTWMQLHSQENENVCCYPKVTEIERMFCNILHCIQKCFHSVVNAFIALERKHDEMVEKSNQAIWDWIYIHKSWEYVFCCRGGYIILNNGFASETMTKCIMEW